MKASQAKRAPRLLIEKARQYCQMFSAEQLVRHGFGHISVAAEQLVVCLERCDEVLWMNSAYAMCEVIRGAIDLEHDNFLMAVDDKHRWIVFETPKETPCGTIAALFVCYRTEKTCFVTAAERVATRLRDKDTQIRRLVADLQAALAASREPHHWALFAFDPQGTIAWSMSTELSLSGQACWSFEIGMVCPFGRCEFLPDGVRICDQCEACAAWMLTWTTTAYRMLAGHYQETPEPVEPEYHTETEVRLVPSPRTWEKPRQTRINHTMQVVRFDASTKRRPAHSSPRGSWIAGRTILEDEDAIYEVDDNAVLYVSISHKAHTRTFSAPRYKAARNQKRSFPAKAWRQPVTVATLKARKAGSKTITQVGARKFAGAPLS